MKKEIYSYNSEYLTCNGSPILPIMGEFHFSRYPEKGVEICPGEYEETGREWRSVATYLLDPS